VFGELNRDQPALERLITNSATLTSTLAERSPDIEALVGNLNGMMGAIGARERELASAIGQLPDFMRQFNTTAVNLRAALDDVDPIVEASKPVARKLQPFARRLRGFARDAVPTVRGLDGIIRRPGAANDLIELTRLQVPLAEIGVGPVNRNGESRPGALPASTQALSEGLPQLEFLRPYVTIEGITGWFDDFGHSGFPDTLGGIGRIGTTFNPFTLEAVPNAGLLPDLTGGLVDLSALQDNLPALGALGLGVGNLRRCPGANERPARDGSNPFTDDGQLDCDPTQLPIGP
jgi:phospholipid/cholesterol/gamma-HCH transport system substrate-binding protein